MTAASQIPDDGGIDLDAALQRLGGDQQLLKDMAAIFIEDAPGLLEQVRSARGGDLPEPAWRAAHSLKGLASNFSEAASNAAQAAEAALREGDAARIEPALAALRQYVRNLTDALQQQVLD